MLAFILRIFGYQAQPKPVAALPPADEPEPVADPPRPTATTVGVDTRIAGPVTSCSDVRIAGEVEGGVSAGGSLVIELEGKVRGPVRAESIVIRGVVSGDIDTNGRLEVGATGRLYGAIRAAEVELSEGAIVEGRMDVGKAMPRRHETLPRVDTTDDFLTHMAEGDARKLNLPYVVPDVA